MTLATNVESRELVDEALAAAVEAGGTLLRPAQERFWGGYSGYFADPDGHAWEVAYNPFWTIGEDGLRSYPEAAGRRSACPLSARRLARGNPAAVRTPAAAANVAASTSARPANSASLSEDDAVRAAAFPASPSTRPGTASITAAPAPKTPATANKAIAPPRGCESSP
jgi:hypothetical protein